MKREPPLDETVEGIHPGLSDLVRTKDVFFKHLSINSTKQIDERERTKKYQPEMYVKTRSGALMLLSRPISMAGRNRASTNSAYYSTLHSVAMTS